MTYKHFTAIFLTLLSLSVKLEAQAPAREFVPFSQFMARTRSLQADSMIRPGGRVKDVRNVRSMQNHILSMYDGVHVNRSFVQGSSTFDCVPIEQQPSVRLLGLRSIETPPPDSMLAAHRAEEDATAGLAAQSAVLEDSQQGMDEFGNAAFCEAGSFPMRRIEMEELLQFASLEEFFHKMPAGAQPTDVSANNEVAPANGDALHKYSHFLQNVDNAGANSSLNLWSPHINTAIGQIFSLSQQWYVGGSGAARQTAEVGWQNYPNKYGDQRSRLFIYFTPDNYTTGCYNHDCAGFVQVANFGTLGGGFSNYSTPGGTQYDFTAQFYLYNGNWWLSIQGTWIGYYPGSLYKGGQMSKFAQKIDFGTETVSSNYWPGIGYISYIWPGGGSGAWSTQGFGHAAYQRNIYYIKTTGGTVWASLTAIANSPACYNTSGQYYSSSSGWGVYFYAGGPGGPNCQ